MEYEEVLVSESPSVISLVLGVIQNYGWYLLIISIISAYIYDRYLKSKVSKYFEAREEAEYAAKYHKNPDIVAARVNAQQAFAEKLQAQYKADAEEYQKKQEEAEAKKREELLQKLDEKEVGSGSRLNKKDTKPDGKTLRDEYNPLMGGSSHNYRPPKRSGCGGGGCGR